MARRCAENEVLKKRRTTTDYTFHGVPSAPFREPKYFSANIPTCWPPLDNGRQWALDHAVEWRVPAKVPCAELRKAFGIVARLHREAVFHYGPQIQFTATPSRMFAGLNDSDRALVDKWTRIPHTPFTEAQDTELLEVVGYFTADGTVLDTSTFARIGAEYHALHAEEVEKRCLYLKRHKQEPRGWTPEEMMVIRYEYQKDPRDETMYERMVRRLKGRTHSACLRKLEFIVHVDEHTGMGGNYYDALQWSNEDVSVGNEPLTRDEENMLAEAVLEYHNHKSISGGWEAIARVLPGQRDPYFLEQVYRNLSESCRVPLQWSGEEDRVLSNTWASMDEPDYARLAEALPKRIPASCYKRMLELIERTRGIQ